MPQASKLRSRTHSKKSLKPQILTDFPIAAQSSFPTGNLQPICIGLNKNSAPPPQAHMLDCLVLSWWNCLGRIGKVWSWWRCVTGGKLGGFKRPDPVPLCSLPPFVGFICLNYSFKYVWALLSVTDSNPWDLTTQKLSFASCFCHQVLSNPQENNEDTKQCQVSSQIPAKPYNPLRNRTPIHISRGPGDPGLISNSLLLSSPDLYAHYA